MYSTETTRTMGQLLGSLYPKPTRWRDGSDGPALYMNVDNLDNAFVLADALEEHGATRLANELGAFARGVQRDLERGYELVRGFRRQQRGIITPSPDKWRKLRSRLDRAIADIADGVDFHREVSKPYIHFRVQRARLNRQGYDERGKYWGGGAPIHRVMAIVPPDVADYILRHGPPEAKLGINSTYGKYQPGEFSIDEHVRTGDAKSAREEVARQFGLRTRRRV